ncbi:MAG: hypothetical protein DMF83_23620 [Acidobacteria bacterium]|nr:MAG: hypothetical protein DMF83_23620 [Acidobacteriota bacterium]
MRPRSASNIAGRLVANESLLGDNGDAPLRKTLYRVRPRSASNIAGRLVANESLFGDNGDAPLRKTLY